MSNSSPDTLKYAGTLAHTALRSPSPLQAVGSLVPSEQVNDEIIIVDVNAADECTIAAYSNQVTTKAILDSYLFQPTVHAGATISPVLRMPVAETFPLDANCGVLPSVRLQFGIIEGQIEEVLIKEYRLQLRRIIRELTIDKLGNVQESMPELRFPANLLRLVKDGFASSVTHTEPGARLEMTAEEWLYLNDAEVASFIETRLRRMFAVLADRFRQEGQMAPAISSSDGFYDNVDYALRDRIPASPKNFPHVSEQIFRSISDFVGSGGHFGGTWGRIVGSSGGLYLDIAKRETTTVGQPRAVILEKGLLDLIK